MSPTRTRCCVGVGPKSSMHRVPTARHNAGSSSLSPVSTASCGVRTAKSGVGGQYHCSRVRGGGGGYVQPRGANRTPMQSLPSGTSHFLHTSTPTPTTPPSSSATRYHPVLDMNATYISAHHMMLWIGGHDKNRLGWRSLIWDGNGSACLPTVDDVTAEFVSLPTTPPIHPVDHPQVPDRRNPGQLQGARGQGHWLVELASKPSSIPTEPPSASSSSAPSTCLQLHGRRVVHQGAERHKPPAG